jgi:hypothetical protein
MSLARLHTPSALRLVYAATGFSRFIIGDLGDNTSNPMPNFFAPLSKRLFSQSCCGVPRTFFGDKALNPQFPVVLKKRLWALKGSKG